MIGLNQYAFTGARLKYLLNKINKTFRRKNYQYFIATYAFYQQGKNKII